MQRDLLIHVKRPTNLAKVTYHQHGEDLQVLSPESIITDLFEREREMSRARERERERETDRHTESERE